MAAQRRSFCFGIPFSTCRFPSFQSIFSFNWSSHNTTRFILNYESDLWYRVRLAYCTLRNGTLRNETKRNEICTLRNEICTLRNENLYFAK